MRTDRIEHPTAAFLLRNSVELLTALAVLFILQAGLVPFDFTIDSEGARPRAFFETATTNASFPDLVSNIFLFLPIGMLLHWTLLRRLRSDFLALPATLVLCAALSGGIEWLQAYSPSRISSTVDVVSNIAGAGAGASLSWLARRMLPNIIGAALFEFHERPTSAMLKAYCASLALLAALPFSFSLDTTRLKQSVKSAVLVPFGHVDNDAALAEEDQNLTNPLASAHVKWHTLKRWSRWAAEAASFAVLVWLLYPFLRFGYEFSWRATKALIWWFGGLLAVALSVLQFLIVSRGFDSTDIVFRLGGIALGLLTHSVYLRRRDVETEEARERRWLRLATLACYATAAYILYTGIIPATFTLSAAAVEESVTSTAFLPFMAYFVTRFDIMMTDVMEKFASHMLFAGLLATCWVRVSRLRLSHQLSYILPVSVIMAITVESVQMFIPVRMTTLSDPLVAAAGCMVGVVLRQHVLSFLNFSATHDFIGPQDVQTLAASERQHTLSDGLIASLTDPDENAPVEPSPTRRAPMY